MLLPPLPPPHPFPHPPPRIKERRKKENMFVCAIKQLLKKDQIWRSEIWPFLCSADLQLKPYRTDDFITQLFYESCRFSAFGYQWSIRASLNCNECKNPSHSIRRSMQYQLSLKSSSPANPIRLHFLLLKGPYGEMKMNPVIYEHEFSSKEPESGFKELPLVDSTECNKILAMKTISLRAILFQVVS